WSREGGIRLLSQLQSSNTISALLKSSEDHSDTAHFAFSALTNMAEALNADQISKLIALLPSADALARPSIVEALFHTGSPTARDYLISDWKKWLPRNELIFAVQVFAQETSTPIGAISAAFLPRNNFDESKNYSSLMDSLDSHDLVLLRSILSMNNQDGFALLKTLANDDRETWRNIYALAIAIAGKDQDLISDWIKRLTGETPDPTPSDFAAAISASLTPEAEKFRVSIHEEGIASSHYLILFWSVMNGRCQAISTDDVRKQIFLSNDAIGIFGRTFIRLTGEITKQEALKFAAYELSSDGANRFLSSWYMHMVRQSGADALKAMFGSSDNPTPRDNAQILATAMLGEKARAREILKNIEFDKTGSNFQSLVIARAWLNMLDDPKNNIRIRYVYGFSARHTFGQIRRLSLTREGDIFALRELLDSSHPVNKPFANLGVVASLTFEPGRWGDVESKMSGTVRAAMSTREAAEPISISMFASNLKGAPERNWQRWWQAHRARVIWNQTTKNFELTELQ
ncbi:MAG: hypothetical protein L3J82_03170, partial [Planctomycetes bacterium]|nr:hypothetical protein [Planctomycetota bacterium]